MKKYNVVITSKYQHMFISMIILVNHGKIKKVNFNAIINESYFSYIYRLIMDMNLVNNLDQYQLPPQYDPTVRKSRSLKMKSRIVNSSSAMFMDKSHVYAGVRKRKSAEKPLEVVPIIKQEHVRVVRNQIKLINVPVPNKNKGARNNHGRRQLPGKENARKEKKFDEADKIRDKLNEMNIELIDHKGKTIWMKKEKIKAENQKLA